MNCSLCNNEAQLEGLCNRHYYRNQWLDNTDMDNLGFVKFTEAVVPDWARQKTAPFQKEVFYNFFQMYKKKHVNKYDRLLAEIAFRGAAKTTGAKELLLYICCFGLEKFVIYCSETNTFAVQDVFEVRRELSTNPTIRQYFGVISSKAVRGQEGEWSRDAYYTTTGTYVLARGVGQQVRSALRNSYRPTLAIINDMDSKNTVKTEYMRASQKAWFFQDMFNAVDDIDGKVFFNGTIIHEDTVPTQLEQNPMWKVFKYPVMDVDDFHRAVALCKVTEHTVVLPSDEVLNEVEPSMKIAWKERLPLKYILTKYSEAFQSNQIDGFYQEYFHIVVPPTAKNFANVKKAYMRYFRQGGQNWLAVRYSETQQEVIYPVKVFLGVDPASSTTAYAKYSVIAILMMNQYRQVFYYGYSRGKFGLRDEFKEGVERPSSDVVVMETMDVKRKGIVDEEIRTAKRFFANGSQIETTQAQQHVYTEVARIMRRNNANHPIYSEKPTENKEDRDAEMLVPDFQTGSAYINYGLDELEIELKSFPRGTTIDIIDAFYHARSIARPADNIAIESLRRRKKAEESELITDFHLL